MSFWSDFCYIRCYFRVLVLSVSVLGERFFGHFCCYAICFLCEKRINEKRREGKGREEKRRGEKRREETRREERRGEEQKGHRGEYENVRGSMHIE